MNRPTEPGNRTPKRLTPAQLASYYRLLFEMTGPCEIWTGTIDDRGYGRAYSATGEWSHAHRVAWENAYGQLPVDVVVRHKCDNKLCVKLAHLVEGTQGQNIGHDAVVRGGIRCGEEHGNNKLSEADVRAIQTSAESQYRIAARYGITQPQVSRIKSQKAWGHVKPRPASTVGDAA